MKYKNFNFESCVSFLVVVILLVSGMSVVSGYYNNISNTISYENNDPNTPNRPTGPENLYPNEYGDYCASATDPDNDKVQIRFDWGNGEISDWSDLVDSGTEACISHAWSSPGLYKVKAQARDEPGATSDWSCELNVVVSDNNDPNTPNKPSGPTILYVGQYGEYCTNATDPDNDKVQIRFDWDDGEISDWSDLVEAGTEVCISHAWNSAGTYSVTAQTCDEHGYNSGWSWGLTVEVYPNTKPNTPITPSGKTNLKIGESGEYCINASDPDGDMIQYRFDWDANGSHDYSDWTDLVPSGTQNCIDHSWSSSGTFIVKAQAKDEPGAVSDWSDGLMVFVNSAPETPNIDGSTSGKPEVNYEYTFNAIDPDGDEVRYHIEWGDDNSETTSFNPSGTDVKITHSWSEKGTYIIKATAEDINGLVSPEAILEVTMPRIRIIITPFLDYLNNHPYLFPLLQILLQRRLVL